MSEANGTVVMEAAPAAAGEAPAPAAAEAAAAAAEAAAAEEARKAAAQAEETSRREELAKTLRACVSAYRKGETEYRKGLILAGEYANHYVVGRLSLGDDRAPALDVIRGQLSVYASSKVDPNELIACWATWHLLCEGPGLADKAAAVPYGHYREGFRQLVRRVNGGTRAETWEVLPDVATEAAALFEATVRDGLSREAVVTKCQDLQRQALRIEADRQAADKAAADAKNREARDAKAAAEKVRQDAERAAEIARQRERAAQDEATRQEAAGAAALATEALRKAQQAERVCQAEAEVAERERKRKEREAEESRKAADRAAEKAARREERRAISNGTKAADARQGSNLLATGKAGTAKDVASMCLELIVSNDEPDSTLAFLLAALDGHKELSRPVHEAIKAFRVRLASASGRKPEAPATAAPEKAPETVAAPAPAPAAA